MINFANSVLWTFDVTLSTTQVQVLDSSTALRTPTQFMSGLRLTNNDASATIYLAGTSSVSPTLFWKALAPGEATTSVDEFMGRGNAVQLHAVASAGTPSLHVEVLQ